MKLQHPSPDVEPLTRPGAGLHHIFAYARCSPMRRSLDFRWGTGRGARPCWRRPCVPGCLRYGAPARRRSACSPAHAESAGTRSPLMFLYQTGGAYSSADLGIAMAQLEMGLPVPGCFLAATVTLGREIRGQALLLYADRRHRGRAACTTATRPWRWTATNSNRRPGSASSAPRPRQLRGTPRDGFRSQCRGEDNEKPRDCNAFLSIGNCLGLSGMVAAGGFEPPTKGL